MKLKIGFITGFCITIGFSISIWAILVYMLFCVENGQDQNEKPTSIIFTEFEKCVNETSSFTNPPTMAADDPRDYWFSYCVQKQNKSTWGRNN